MAVNNIVVPILEANNYNNWEFRMKLILQRENCSEALEDPPEETATNEVKLSFSKADIKAQSLIVQGVSDKHLDIIKDCTSAKSQFESLKNVFVRTSSFTKLSLWRKLINLKHDVNEGLEDHFFKFETIIRELKDQGSNINDSDQVCHFLLSLPSKYDIVVTAIETIKDVKMDFVKSRLLDEELKISSKDSIENEKVFKASTNKGCFTCGSTLHIQVYCPKRKVPPHREGNKNFQQNNRGWNTNYKNYQNESYQNKRDNYRESKQAANTAEDTYVNLYAANVCNEKTGKIVFVLDSGASNHFVQDCLEPVMHDVEKLTHFVEICTANGQVMRTNKQGVLKAECQGRKINIKALIVPGIKHNLISASKMTDNGHKIIVEQEKTIITSNNFNLECEKENGLFVLKLDEIIKKTENCQVMVKNLWHKRLGHASKEAIAKLGLKMSDTICSSCVEGKATRYPFKRNEQKAKTIGELVHSDICGPINPGTYDEGPNIKTAIAILNCLLARQLCFEDVSCSAILEIIPRVCGPELVACSTVTVTKCQAALRTLQAFPFFKPTCLCREPHVDPECNSFRDFLFDHPCVFVLKKEKDPYPVDALPTCNHALSVCQREEKCIKLFEDFKTNCKVRDNKCRMDDRELCHESWTNLRLSPMFGCICPNNHMKRRCDRIFGIVNHNPCVDMLPISLDLSGTESALYPNNPENGYFNSLWLPPTKTNQYPYFLHPATNRPRTYLHITSNIISPSPSIHQMHHFNNHHHHYAQSGTFMPVSTSGTSHKSSSSSVADSDYNHQLSIEETLNTPLEFDELPSEDIVVTVTRLSGGSADVKVISPSKNASAGITYDVEFESQLKNPLVDFSGSMGHEHHRHMPDGPRDILGIDRGEFPHHHNYTSGEEYHLHHHQRHSSPSDITKFAFKSTCHLALENCNNDYMCRAALQPVLHHCDTSQCHRNSCMEALQNLYRKPELSWSLEIAFCLCKTSENKQDACLVAQEKLHPICAQRVEGNQVLPPCHTLAEECRKDIDCKIRLEFYEQSCAVDSTTKKCAGPPSECRAAMLGILGTELRTTCGCKGTDFTQLYDCLGWQRLLWVNPCVVQSQSDFHIKNAAIELAKMSTTPTTTIQPIASTWRSRIQLSTTLAPITTITMETTTLTTEPTEPTTTEMITTTTSTTTSTTPPRFCVVQKPHQTTQYIREGKSKRLNRDDELECSDLCQCAESLIVICHTICVDRIPCKTEFAFYNHAAPAYQAYRGRCLCYSGQFICMRPTPGEYKLPQGVFLFLGYSETDEALLKPHSNLSVQDVVQSLQELIMHETSCQLSIFNVTKANVILVAKIRDDDEEDETKILIKEQEQCAQILEDISEKINTQHPEFNSHLLLSIFKMAEVEVIPAKINAQQKQTTSSPVLITLSTILVLHRVIIRSTSSWHFLHHL